MASSLTTAACLKKILTRSSPGLTRGAAEGNPKDMPPNPKYPEGWQIGKPDVVLSMTEVYNVPAEGVIPYKYFAVPTNFTEDKYVQFAEIRQGNRKLVHHIIVNVRYPEHGNLPKPGEIPPEELAAARGARQAAASGPPIPMAGW